MAINAQEVELVQGGCELRAPSDGRYVQNMLFDNNALHVRKGFGQVAQFDTTMSGYNNLDPRASAGLQWGYRKHLGSRLITTSFGHEQLVSVFVADVFTNNTPTLVSKLKDRKGEFTAIYLVNIYDLTTGSRWEEPLYRHTSSHASGSADARDMQFWHAHYETNADRDYRKWIYATNPETFFFTELYDVLYFGNPETGLLSYFPGTFRRATATERYTGDTHVTNLQQSAQLDTVVGKGAARPFGESALIKQAVATSVSLDVDYLSQGNFPRPYTVTSYAEAAGGSLVLVAEDRRTIWFSEASHPTAIPVFNFLVFPGDELITAVAEQAGNVVIWTENTTWIFHPSSGFLHTDTTAGARLIQVSDTIGCSGQSVVVKGSAFGSLYWMDKRGCYRAVGNMAIEALSQPIDPFFSDFVTNPLHSYFQDAGHVLIPSGDSVIRDQARTMLKYDPEDVSATYWPDKKLVIYTIPKIDLMLVWHETVKQWTFWTTESIATEDSSDADSDDTELGVAGATRNIQNPWPVANASGLYIVGGIDTADGVIESQTEDSNDGSRETDQDTTNRSYYILKYGRGGGVDRSVEEGEDQRIHIANYRDVTNTTYGAATLSTRDSAIVFGKPIHVPYGETVGFNAAGSTVKAAPATPAFWVPVYFVLGDEGAGGTAIPTAADIQSMRIEFTFDSGAFQPVFRTDANHPVSAKRYELAWEPFPQRAASRVGWGYDFPLNDGSSYNAGRKICAYSGTGVGDSSRTGNRIVAVFDAHGAHISYPAVAENVNWGNAPYMQIGKKSLTPLFLLPFVNLQDTQVHVGMGIEGHPSRFTIGGGSTYCQFWVWEQTALGNTRRYDNDVLNAQPVDWLIKGQDLGAKDGKRFHGRGTFSRLLSHGPAEAAQHVTPNWTFGLYNSVFGSDRKAWSTQVVDTSPSTFDSGNPTAAVVSVTESADGDSQQVDTLRNRFTSSGGAKARTFNNGLKYGNPATNTTDHVYLIDDEEINDLSVSTSTKGSSLSFMTFGHIQNKAQKLVIESIKAVFRVLTSGRRRRGR